MSLPNRETTFWIIDNSIALLLFGNRIHTKIILPNALKQVTLEQYHKVKTRVIAFKTSLLFEKNSELISSSDKINALLWKQLNIFLDKNNKDKAFNPTNYYKIQNNELIEVESNCFLCIRCEPICVQKGIRFYIDKGNLKEMHRYIEVYDKQINGNYFEVKNKFLSNIIYFILGSSSETTSQGVRKRELVSVFKKLESITIEDNKLVLTAYFA
ncbi:MAG: hypothetical protein J7641_10990 [Cyanobacteria bacterium SID2]|nr:hypothetical protein [Cyanobacteria bacterium SID2]MBP0002283.1 hypothetical protein [Cyanobacteria bacterium SBC]